MTPPESWNTLLATEIGTMRQAAFDELEGDMRKTVVTTASHFVRELERKSETDKSGFYGKTIGVRSQHILALIIFLEKHMPKFMRYSVFDINMQGFEQLVKQTGCLFFVRLDLSIPLALALILPELEQPKL